MGREESGAQTVQRAIGLLQHFTDARPQLRASELARLSGLGQSTTSRLIGTLEGLGFLERDPQTGLCRLGRQLITLGGVALNQEPVFREARMVAQGIAYKLGLGANVAVRDGTAAIYVAHFEGALVSRSQSMVGRRISLHATGLGKAMLSELPEEEVTRLVPAASMLRLTPNTVVTHEALHGELALVRERGYARELEELAFGRACLAAPIRDQNGEIVAAMSISGSLSALRLDERERELAGAVIEAADSVSVALGYGPSHAAVG